MPGDRTELVFRLGGFALTQKVEGVEKLKNLKKLNIQMGGNYSDYSFLKHLEKLEILIMAYCSIDNLYFLKKMKNLEVFILAGSNIYKNEIDLKNNQKIRYLNIAGIGYRNERYSSVPFLPFIPEIKNIPKSLEYLEIGDSPYIILSEEFLSKLVLIPNIILGKDNLEYHRKELKENDEFTEVHKSYINNWDFIQSHTNFMLKESKDVLPEKYQDKTLFSVKQWMEEDIEPMMKEVPDEKK